MKRVKRRSENAKKSCIGRFGGTISILIGHNDSIISNGKGLRYAIFYSQGVKGSLRIYLSELLPNILHDN
jgi:hypothetical protein